MLASTRCETISLLSYACVYLLALRLILDCIPMLWPALLQCPLAQAAWRADPTVCYICCQNLYACAMTRVCRVIYLDARCCAGKYTVPVFWDKQTNSIVNNECVPISLCVDFLCHFWLSNCVTIHMPSLLENSAMYANECVVSRTPDLQLND